MKYTYKAFTLAEILITLTVIGVIAAITIPAVTQNIQDMQNKVALKNAYQILSDATKKVVQANGGSLKGVITDESVMKNLFLPYLSYTKQCEMNQTVGNCRPDWYSPSRGIMPWQNKTGLILNNGYLIYFLSTSINCAYDDYLKDNFCGTIAVDINGFKSPNTFSKDVFRFLVQENRLIPTGVNIPSCQTNPTTASLWGDNCTSYYLLNH